MRKIFSIAIIAALMASPVAAAEAKPEIVPCKVVAPASEKEMKIAIRKLKRQGYQVAVIRGGEKKIIAQGGDPFPFALAQANVVKSGCAD